MYNSNIQVSVETPDLLRLQTNAIEQATGALLPGSIHYGINSNNLLFLFDGIYSFWLSFN